MNERSLSEVESANVRLIEIWKLGEFVGKQTGENTPYRKMQELSKGNASAAERLRKLRSMAKRITRQELDNICNYSREHSRCLGYSFLIELSRVKGAKDRKRIAKQAIESGLSSRSLRRLIDSIQSRPVLDTKRHSRRGAKRKLDWKNNGQVMNEIIKVSNGFVYLYEDISKHMKISGDADSPIDSGLLKQMKNVVKEVSKLRKLMA